MGIVQVRDTKIVWDLWMILPYVSSEFDEDQIYREWVIAPQIKYP